jgi:hypothetical protein
MLIEQALVRGKSYLCSAAFGKTVSAVTLHLGRCCLGQNTLRLGVLVCESIASLWDNEVWLCWSF